MYPRVTKIFWSRSLKTQESLRLLQPSHGCDPEHLIFCLRHRTQLRKVSDYDSRVALRFPGFRPHTHLEIVWQHAVCLPP